MKRQTPWKMRSTHPEPITSHGHGEAVRQLLLLIYAHLTHFISLACKDLHSCWKAIKIEKPLGTPINGAQGRFSWKVGVPEEGLEPSRCVSTNGF